MSNANDLDPLRCTCGYTALRNRMSRHMHAWAVGAGDPVWGSALWRERLATIAALGLTITNERGKLYGMSHRLCVSVGENTGDWNAARRRVALAKPAAKNQKVLP